MSTNLTSHVVSAKSLRRIAQRGVGKRSAVATTPIASVVRTQLNHEPFDADARHRMIADAAYYLAAQRGFEPGHELEDWLTAEQEFEARLCGETHPF